ncbi:MAG: GNAT family N-acetyltransferase [Chloroflexi bacterium]|nr:GNAT family N-acetyltransferase [Chloroflexota bacterium]
MTEKNIIRDLGDGLILRRAAIKDVDELAAFNSNVHKDDDAEGPDEFIAAWVHDLMTKPHPTLKEDDFTFVVDTKNGKIVSSLNLIPQTWSYAGVEFGVGRPELVGTAPGYRRRGLIRAQFEVIHQWSAERGHKMQAITGIPYYYRQFEYEMGLTLGGGRIGYLPHIPKLKDDEVEKYKFRPATCEDIPLIMQAYEKAARRSLIACLRDAAIWQYELTGKSEKIRANYQVIETLEKEPVGFLALALASGLWKPVLRVWGYELIPGISWLDVTPSVIRYLEKIGQEYAKKKEKVEFQGYNFNLGAEHTVYDVLPERMPRVAEPYAWYVRVPDLPDFLSHIGPVLERRLADSPLVGHTGDLKLSFFRSGVKLSFEGGKLKGVEAWMPESAEDGDVLFPDLTFLRVLLGYTSFAELEKMFADCHARNDHGRALMPVLFPKQASNVWCVG